MKALTSISKAYVQMNWAEWNGIYTPEIKKDCKTGFIFLAAIRDGHFIYEIGYIIFFIFLYVASPANMTNNKLLDLLRSASILNVTTVLLTAFWMLWHANSW